jgi:RHS repeat-associated protein
VDFTPLPPPLLHPKTTSHRPGDCAGGALLLDDPAALADSWVTLELSSPIVTLPHVATSAVWASAANRAGWGQNTKEYDPASELTYMNQRWYDPALGIFTSTAPYPPMIEHPYTFAEGNPVNFVDPDGRYAWPIHAACGVAGRYVATTYTPRTPPNAANVCEALVEGYLSFKLTLGLGTQGTIVGTGIGAAIGASLGAAVGGPAAPATTVAGGGKFGVIGGAVGGCVGGFAGGFLGHHAGRSFAPGICNSLWNCMVAGLGAIKKALSGGGGGGQAAGNQPNVRYNRNIPPQELYRRID